MRQWRFMVLFFSFLIHQPLYSIIDEWCSSFSQNMVNGDFKATFTADKLFITSLRGERANSEGTVDRGAAGSTTYTGALTFFDADASFTYEFDVKTATFSWTPLGGNSVTTSWPNCFPVECPLPGRFEVMLQFDMNFTLL